MLVDVALALPLFRSFTYEVKPEDQAKVTIGTRVVVPFRNKREIGVVVGEGTRQEGIRYKAILEVPDAAPVIDPPMLDLCRWIADYYVVPLGVALRAALPAALTGAAAPLPTQKKRRVVQLAMELPSLMRREAIFARAKQQRALYELLESLGGRAAVEHLTEQLHFSPSVLKGLVARGLATVEDEVVARDPFLTRAPAKNSRHAPTPAQQAAIDAMAAGTGGDVFLLHGITGSGKTLVYVELLRKIVDERGKSAIVLVPEIALTPQTVDRFRAAFGERIAVGARSAIFAPLTDLGAIIVDEEHEGSYKQAEAPRYHAREVAIVRARAEGAVVVLGSATPSLESWANAQVGKYQLLELPDRVGGGRLPIVEAVDLRAAEKAHRERWAQDFDSIFRSVISERVEVALADRLEKGEQSILLLNRRGYASFVQCAACGDVATCPNCSISLTYHRSPERLVCHYCQHDEPPEGKCRRCGGEVMKQRGLGTQQVERLLADRFPAARIARMDVDTTSGKWAHATILDRVGAGEVDILLGTQMIAKGLDFPNVTLVGVVDADVGINLPDFRASERCFQLLAQVAGRAGRGPKGGEVLIQTRVPGHHAVRCALTHDYHAFVREELEGRDSPAYPPVVRLANVVFSGVTEDAVVSLATQCAAWLHRLVDTKKIGVQVIGPAPAPVERIKNRWRWHLLLKADHPREMTRVCRYLVQRFPVPKEHQLRLALDRDPVALL